MSPIRRRFNYGYSILCGVVAFGCAAILFARSGVAAPLAQALLPNFITTAQTTITVTVALDDGQTILVPIDLEFVNWHEEEGGYISLVATTEQQPNMFIAVEESNVISTSMQAIVYVTSTPPPLVVVPVVPTATIAPLVINTPTPTQAVAAAQEEISTIGEWVAASEEQKRATALLWSQRLVANGTISVSAEWYANELFDCVDIALSGSVEPFGESYSILDIAAVCIATMGTP